jgi:hypothetical protein
MAARLIRDKKITARRLHLADERARRGRIEQDGLFRPGSQ